MLAELTGEQIFPIFGWTLGILAAVVVAYLLVMRLKAYLSNDIDLGSAPAGFSLSDLRQLHAAGQMSDEEFERAKAKLIQLTQKATEAAANKGQKKPVPRVPDVKP